MALLRSIRQMILPTLVLGVCGLGLGVASSYLLPPSRNPVETTSAAMPANFETPEKPPILPPTAKPQPNRRALLIGVTRYDNLAEASHLQGPGNDVKLMRSTLVDYYGFPPEQIVALAEDEGKPELRPTRANIAREFKRLADAAKAGDQVVVLLAGHGDRQPESDPPDPVSPDPDGIDEIFLPADVKPWKGYPERVPNAIADKELRDWLSAITAKKAYVWSIFDCCHSASMTRAAGETPRQLPMGVLVPPEALAKAREQAAKRTGQANPEPTARGNPFAASSEYLVAMFACREFEITPECPQPATSSTAKPYGLFSYSLVSGLVQSASTNPLTYRELLQRVQSNYLNRPQGSPTPTVDGVGQDRVILGSEKPVRPKITLLRVQGDYVVNVGDLHGVTTGSILSVYSPPGKDAPRVIGYVRVQESRSLDSIVTPTEYDGMAKPASLPIPGQCELVAIDYATNQSQLALAIDPDSKGQDELRKQVEAVVQSLPKTDAGLFRLEKDLAKAHLLLRLATGGTELQETYRKRPPVPLPATNSEQFGEQLIATLKAIRRARSLIEIGASLERNRAQSGESSDVKIEVIGHRDKNDPGRVLECPPTGWLFLPGDRVSFRVTNTSKTKRLEVTLLVVGLDYKIFVLYPARNQINKALEPGASFNTRSGEYTEKPPFGAEQMVAIITSPTNPAVDYRLLTQPGVIREGYSAKSPVAQLLERGMYGVGTRSGMQVSELEDQGACVLSWRTEPKPK